MHEGLLSLDSLYKFNEFTYVEHYYVIKTHIKLIWLVKGWLLPRARSRSLHGNPIGLI